MFMEELFNKCELCPRKCMVNRNIGKIGYCRASNKMKIGGYHLHMWEEPVITGDKGSGTIFFSYCNLRCVYCQNYDISFNCIGEEITVNRLADIMIELQDMGALNINLVTPSHYIPLIRDSIIMAKDSGLTIPIIYNTSGYDRVESLKLLEENEVVCFARFEYKECRTKIPYLKKVENGYMAGYPHLSAYPKESEALIMKINEIILSHCGIHVTQNRIVYLNKEYIRKESLDLNELLCISDKLFNKRNHLSKTIAECIDEVDIDLDRWIERTKEILNRTSITPVRTKQCTALRR